MRREDENRLARESRESGSQECGNLKILKIYWNVHLVTHKRIVEDSRQSLEPFTETTIGDHSSKRREIMKFRILYISRKEYHRAQWLPSKIAALSSTAMYFSTDSASAFHVHGTWTRNAVEKVVAKERTSEMENVAPDRETGESFLRVVWYFWSRHAPFTVYNHAAGKDFAWITLFSPS